MAGAIPATCCRTNATARSPASILDDWRKDRAVLLLEARDPPRDAIADELGCSDVANLTRAFERWTRTTPVDLRRD